MFSKVGVKVFLGYYWIKTFFWIFCFAKILRTRKKKLKFGQISTKPGQNISRLPFLHHKLHEFSFPCHSLVSSFFSTHRPVPARCARGVEIYKCIQFWLWLSEIGKKKCNFFFIRIYCMHPHARMCSLISLRRS